MNKITVSEAAHKLGKTPGELFGYTHMRLHGASGTPQRFWLYQAFTDAEVSRMNNTVNLKKIIPDANHN